MNLFLRIGAPLAAGALLFACSSLKDGGDAPGDGDGGTDGAASSSGSSSGTTSSSSSGGTSGDGGSSSGSSSGGGLGKGNGDPRYPQGPVPADSPPVSAYTITDGKDGALILDKVTGITWQDTVPDMQVELTLAQNYCMTLSYDGLTGWRLPTRLEALSIMDIEADVSSSNVTTSVFSAVKDYHCFWTASAGANSSPDFPYQWYSNSAGVQTIGVEDETCSTRCVQGPPIPATPIPMAYELSDPLAVHDPVTGLTWERTVPSMSMTPDVEKLRCSQLMIGGKQARLPGVKELASIVDEFQSEPASVGAFGSISDEFFTSNDNWSVSFDSGSVTSGPTDGFMHYARCVTGP